MNTYEVQILLEAAFFKRNQKTYSPSNSETSWKPWAEDEYYENL